MSYVVCREKITSIAPPTGFPLPANVECGEKVDIVRVCDLMDCMCPRGHRFIATPADVQPDGPNPEFRFVCPGCGDTQEVWPQGRCNCGAFHLVASREA